MDGTALSLGTAVTRHTRARRIARTAVMTGVYTKAEGFSKAPGSPPPATDLGQETRRRRGDTLSGRSTIRTAEATLAP